MTAVEQAAARVATFSTGEGLELELDLTPHPSPLLEWARRTFSEVRRIKPAGVRCASCFEAQLEVPATWWLETDTPGGMCDPHLKVLVSRVRAARPAMSIPKGRR